MPVVPDDILLHRPIGNKTLVKFQPTDEEMIRKSVIKGKDRPGLSGMNTETWRRIISLISLEELTLIFEKRLQKFLKGFLRNSKRQKQLKLFYLTVKSLR